MVDITKLQNSVFQNKLSKGFNTTDINTEFCLLYGEVAEAFEAYKNGGTYKAIGISKVNITGVEGKKSRDN